MVQKRWGESRCLINRARWPSPGSVVWIAAIGATLLVDRPVQSAPSFDCKAASSAVEILICSNKSLSAQDFLLAAIYRHNMELTRDRQSLLMDQRVWLKSRVSVCSVRGGDVRSTEFDRFRATTCLFALYSARIATLSRPTGTVTNVQPKIRIDDITADDARARIVAAFQGNLNGFYDTANVRINSCDEALSYTQLDVFGQDSSYGAQCRVEVGGQALSVLMCDDWMVGKWHIAESRGSVDRKSLTQFVGDNCPPGG